MTERRTHSRNRTYLRGVVSYQNGTLSEDCVIRNLTAQGAMIEHQHPSSPVAFDLLVPERATQQSARVVWRNGLRTGVRFVAAPPARRPPRVATFEGG